MNKKFNWGSVGVSIVGMAGFLYTIRTLDFDTQFSLGVNIFLVLSGLRFSVKDSQSRKLLKYASLLFIGIVSIFIGLCNLI